MLRTFAALSVLGLLTVVLLASLNGGGNAVTGLLPGNDRFEVMVNTNTGQPLTLEMVQRDVQWHQETARKLREFD